MIPDGMVEFQGTKIEIINGYMDATALCKKVAKEFDKWRNDGTA